MGWIAEALTIFNRTSANPPAAVSLVTRGTGLAQIVGGYQGFAGAYAKNEIVFSALELLATSASEPKIVGKRYAKSRSQVRNMRNQLRAREMPERAINAHMIANQIVEDVSDHPLVQLLNNPNPFMSRFHLWSTIIMDRYLAGNAYLLKARAMGAPRELWRLRPDRVRVIPDASKYIAGYEYKVGNDTFVFPVEDVVHFKTRNPLDDYYGMPPLMAISGRIDIDNYQKQFLKDFYERGGSGPGAILTVKGTMKPEAKEEIRDRLRRLTGGRGGHTETLILDNTESTYTNLGLDRGLRDALPKELDAMSEARIAMVFGIPGSILGLLIGYESSSYANKRQDWQVLWDMTLAPLYSDFDDVLNLSFLNPERPDFGGIDEVAFDLTQVRALQEDEDKLQDRARKNFQAGGMAWEEFRVRIGLDPEPGEGLFAIPAGVTLTPADRLDGEDDAGGDVQTLALNGAQIVSLLEVVTAVTLGQLAPETAKAMIRVSFPSISESDLNTMVDAAAGFTPETPAEPAEPSPAEAIAAHYRAEFAPKVGRPKLLADPGARATWEKAAPMLAQGKSVPVVAGLLGMDERTLRRYKATFKE